MGKVQGRDTRELLKSENKGRNYEIEERKLVKYSFLINESIYLRKTLKSMKYIKEKEKRCVLW